MSNSPSRKFTRASGVRRTLAVVFVLAIMLVPHAAVANVRGASRLTRVSGRKVRAPRPARRAKARAEVERPDTARQFVPPAQPDGGESPGEDIEARERWWVSQRAYPFESIPADGRRRAWEVVEKMEKARRAAGLSVAAGGAPFWRPVGPVSTTASPYDDGTASGHINAVAVSPANPNLVLAGAAAGGIWRSTDGGAHFIPVSDEHVDLELGSIAFAPSNPSIVYAGMGDPKYGSDFGAGVLKSTDAGRSWARVNNATLPSPGRTVRIVVDPTDPNRVNLALYGYRNASGGYIVGGIYRSTDGGVNWSLRLGCLMTDLVVHPSNPQTLYAWVQNNFATANNRGLFRSSDGGQTWTRIFDLPFDAGGGGDALLAVSPASPQSLYLIARGPVGGVSSLRFASTADNGETWDVKTPTGLQTNGYTYLAADPAGGALYTGIYAGDIFKSTDGGATWVNVSVAQNRPRVHTDQHGAGFGPDGALYVAGDGGLWKTADGAATFQNLNSTLSVTQFYTLNAHPTDPSVTFGGTQDNGAQERTPGALSWREIQGGDGGPTVVNKPDSGKVFATYQGGNIIRLRRVSPGSYAYEKAVGSPALFGEPTASQSRVAFIAPITGNGSDARLYAATYRLFVSADDGDSWVAPGGETDLTKGGTDVVSEIAVARSNPNVIYTGSDKGRVMVSQDAGATWTDRTAGLPNRYVSCIHVDPVNPAVAYLTVSGYFTAHVFKTTDAGASWANLNGNLPDVPASAVVEHAGTLYVGTDIGVFRSTPGGGTWEYFSDGMPPAPVTAFAVTADGRLQAATFGRGAYELSLRPTGCTYGVSAATRLFASAGGAGSVSVSASGAGCEWSISGLPAWVTPTGAASGSGSGSFGFSVAPNTTLAARSVTLRVAGQAFSISQSPSSPSPGCNYPPDVVSWYPAEGTAADLGGLNPAQLLNGATYTSAGKVGQSFNFDGVDDQLRASTANFPTGGADRTIEFWVRKESSGDAVLAGYGASGVGGLFQLVTTGGALTLNTSSDSFTHPTPLAQNTWYHVAVTNAGVAAKLYVNGQPSSAGGRAIFINTAAGSTFYAGSQPNDSRRLKGQIDELAVYNRALSNEEIAAIYAAGAAGKCGANAPPTSTFRLGQTSFVVNEDEGRVIVPVRRAGQTAAAASVDFATVDNPAAVRCDTVNGTPYARCDYATTVETVTFAPGESERTVSIPLIDDANVETPESFSFLLRNPVGGVLASSGLVGNVTIYDNDTLYSAQNPVNTTAFFVRQHYLDFLSREPEVGEPWSATLDNCAAGDARCDRVSVSAAFFGSPEFRLKGFYVFTFYEAAFNRLPAYEEIVPDMRQITGQTPAELYAKRAAFAAAFTQRPEFKTAFDPLSAQQYVDALMGRYGLQSITTPDPASPDTGAKVVLTRDDLVAGLNNSALTRAQVLRAVVQSDEVGAREFNRAFVAMQYYGYLRRAPEAGGFQAWLDTINANPADTRAMVNGFMNSQEYRLRFGRP